MRSGPQHEDFDPQHEDFDPYECWEKANCSYVEEVWFGSPEDDDFDEVLICGAPECIACPLLSRGELTSS